MVLSGEVEILTAIPGMDEEEDGEGYGDNEDDMPIGAIPAGIARPIPVDSEDINLMTASPVKAAINPFPHSGHHTGSHLAHILPRPAPHSNPIIAQSISNVSFENPAMASLYDQQSQVPSQQYQMQFNHNASLDSDKPAAWTNQIFTQVQQQLPNQQAVFTAPTASHGPSPNGASQQFAHQAYYQAPRQQHPAQHIYGSPVDSEDASSISSGLGFGERDRSNGSPYGSPQDSRASSVSSQPGSYEMPGVLTSGGIPTRMSAGGAMWNGNDMDNIVAPNMIAVGAGGGNGGYAMVM